MTTVAERAKRLREETGIGIYEARRQVELEDLLEEIVAANTIADIKLILLKMLRREL